jgi:hypothetical protein
VQRFWGFGRFAQQGASWLADPFPPQNGGILLNRWFRVYDDVINDPKLLKLPEASRWYWIAMLCAASKNAGRIPPLADLSLHLRVAPAKATALLFELQKAGLIDKTETGFEPHNWSGRQYKSDVSTDRVKRFRKQQRNVSPDVSETPPETETETETKKTSEAKASGADAPDPRTRLFSEGLAKIAELTGKGPDSCRTFVGKCLKETNDDASVVLGIIDDAYRNRVADAGAWIMARLKGAKQVGGFPAVDWDAVLSAYKKTGHWSRYAGNDPSSPGCRCPPEILAKYGLLTQSETVQ